MVQLYGVNDAYTQGFSGRKEQQDGADFPIVTGYGSRCIQRRLSAGEHMKDRARRIIVLATTILTIVLFVQSLSLAIVYSESLESNRLARLKYIEWQKAHVSWLAEEYAANTAVKVDESAICGFDLESAIASGVKINELVYLTTHNSYKQGVSDATAIYYHYFRAIDIGKSRDYACDDLTQQFNTGIRGLELDIVKYKTSDGFRLETYHDYYMETNSTAIDFGLALQEIKMWSDYNAGHLPLIIVIEPKQVETTDEIEKMDVEGLRTLNAMLSDSFGDSLITYSDMLGEYEDFEALREANGYMTIADALGKVIFILHEYDDIKDYLEFDKEEMTLLPLLRYATIKSGNYNKVTCIAQDNTFEQPEKAAELVAMNYIVRTRLDAYPKYDYDIVARLNTNSNLLSTDYPPSVEHSYEYTATISSGGETVILRKH